jgi:ABC-type multidrug transport system fused ATPase/permease subunit
LNLFQQFWQIIDQRQRNRGLRLVIITVVGSFLEAAGVGLVIPFIAIIMSADFVLPSFLIEQWPGLAVVSRTQLVVGAVVVFLLFYLAKSLFSLWLAACQAGYYYSLQEAISGRLFKSYLYRAYAFHLQHNSAKLLSNTMTESMQFSIGFTAAAVLMLNDFLIIVMILVVLFLVEPAGAIMSFVLFGTMSLLLFTISKKRSVTWGEARQEKERLRIKSAQQGFNGVKDIKLYGRENIFISQYLKETRISLEAGRKQTILQNVPRIFLEMVAVFALCGLVIFLFVSGDEAKIVTTLGLFAAAAFKLLPTTARLVQSGQAIVFNRPVVSFIYNELVETENLDHSNNDASGVFDPEVRFVKNINLSNLSFTYEGVDQAALASISLNIDAGKMIGFIGYSGAGKSTLIDCILGLIHPSSGELKIDGESITSRNVTGWQRKLGYVSQVIYLLDGSLRENIGFGIPSDAVDEQKLMNAVEKAQLTEFIDSLPDGLETMVGERGVRLSGGQRQRIGIARALYDNPPVLVLDEATSSLDTDTEREVMKAVEELQGSKTILIIAHRFSTIENCDYVYKLDKGRIVAQGEPQDVLGV